MILIVSGLPDDGRSQAGEHLAGPVERAQVVFVIIAVLSVNSVLVFPFFEAR